MVKNRSEIIFLYDILDNNPNGDPLDSNKPRIDEETSTNIVTDVRLKRTSRDYLHDYKKQEIFVIEVKDDEGHVYDAKQRVQDFGWNGKKINNEEKAKIAKEVLDRCIDVRLFGGTLPLEKDSITFTGPVQFNMGRSLHKVSLKRIKGTGAFASGKDKSNKTFREEYILPYSLIGFYGIINEHAAEKTNLSEDDIKLLLDSMWNGTKNLISRSKIGQLPRLLIKVNYKEDNFHIGGLLNKITLDKKVEDEAIRSPKDYTVDVTEFVKSIKDNKDKVLNIEYLIDSELILSKDGDITSFVDALPEVQVKEITL